MAGAIEGYASVTSAAPGDVIDFHVRASGPDATFSLDIYRRGVRDELVAAMQGEAFVPGAQDDAELAANGCAWPAADSCRTTVPAQWRSGYYVAKAAIGSAVAWLPFFVRSATPGESSAILLKMSDATAQAYTAWGGRSFYSTPHAPQISFDRPYDDIDLFERYQLPFVRWAERTGIALDFCSSLDLHVDPRILRPYRLLVSLGHDEYWSLEMRDQVEAFIAGGGNVCFFSANTCYWQVRLDLTDERRLMTCYKETEGKPPDPQRDDPSRVTVRWYEAPVLRPENRMTGVSYRNGAGWWIDPVVAQRRFRGYTVANAGHWIFANSGLADGAEFGAGATVDDTILGYETDAAMLVHGTTPPRPAGTDGTPADFEVLATADLADWAPNGQGGAATMGAYRRNGFVFTVGTVNWAGGLSDQSAPPVRVITENALRTLSVQAPPRLALANASFEEWNDTLPAGWILDGAGTFSAEPLDARTAANQMRFIDAGVTVLKVDAAPGETWIGCAAGINCSTALRYGAGCWIKCAARGATIRLQTTDTWDDFAVAEHSGSGAWEYVFAAGSVGRAGADVPARVKLQVAAGCIAFYDGVSVIELSGNS